MLLVWKLRWKYWVKSHDCHCLFSSRRYIVMYLTNHLPWQLPTIQSYVAFPCLETWGNWNTCVVSLDSHQLKVSPLVWDRPEHGYGDLVSEVYFTVRLQEHDRTHGCDIVDDFDLFLQSVHQFTLNSDNLLMVKRKKMYSYNWQACICILLVLLHDVVVTSLTNVRYFPSHFRKGAWHLLTWEF